MLTRVRDLGGFFLLFVAAVPARAQNQNFPPTTANWSPVYYQAQNGTVLSTTTPSPLQFVSAKHVGPDRSWGWYSVRNTSGQTITATLRVYCESLNVFSKPKEFTLTFGPNTVMTRTRISCPPAYMDSSGSSWNTLHVYLADQANPTRRRTVQMAEFYGDGNQMGVLVLSRSRRKMGVGIWRDRAFRFFPA
jgi:hypothetical protein